MIAAQHIKDLRLNHNYSQSYVAHELNVSQKTYSNMESGKSKIFLEHLRKLASIYNIEITAFMKQISQTDSNTITSITEANEKISGAELYDGINSNLPFELINQLKARIDDLNKLVKSKDTRIETLTNKINLLEGKSA
jgi:transcriptional regulator with XRE-family HTH domain